MQKTKIIFLGTPAFAVPVLVRLIESDFKPAIVITQPDKPVGRSQKLIPSPVKQVAMENQITVYQPKSKTELANFLKKEEPDLCILIAFGMIIPEYTLKIPQYGFLNLHPSLLPKYRGSSPIQATLLAGEHKTGITIIKLNKEIDAGAIVAQKEIEIKPNDHAKSLHDALGQMGAELLVKILPDYLAGKVSLIEQDHFRSTLTGMISRKEGKVDWQKSALEILRQFRAFFPWPGLFTCFVKKRLKIVKLDLKQGDFNQKLKLGEVFLGSKQEVLVKCSQAAVELITVQLEGKKEMSIEQFVAGHKNFIGSVLS
jgi:methionyl-tRNA formyltransferase